MIDFSPSAACSDINIKSGAVLLDQQIKVLRRSLEGVIRPFYVPGSQVLFKPDHLRGELSSIRQPFVHDRRNSATG